MRRRPEHQPIDDAEHRGVRADAECERGDDGEREARTRAQSATSVAQIAHRVLEQMHAARISRFFFHAIEAAEGEARAPRGFVDRDPRAHVLRGFALEMKSELVVELALHFCAPENRAQAIAHVAPEVGQQVRAAHRMSRTRRTATVRRRHASVSVSSWLRPVRVSS